MSAVWERFPQGGSLLLTALAIADHASDDGTRVYPAVDALAIKTRQSGRTIQRQLRELEAMGWLLLVRESSGKPGDTRDYRICPQWIRGETLPTVVATGDNLSPLQTGDKSEPEQAGRVTPEVGTGDTAMSPKPSITIKSEEQPSKAARGRAKARAHHPHTLPPGIPAEPWERWLEMRAEKKAWLTEGAFDLAISTLARLKGEGHSPADVLNQSTLCNWTGLFHVKPSFNRGTVGGNAAAVAEFVAQIEREHGEVEA